jgi:hypothetical protein
MDGEYFASPTYLSILPISLSSRQMGTARQNFLLLPRLRPARSRAETVAIHQEAAMSLVLRPLTNSNSSNLNLTSGRILLHCANGEFHRIGRNSTYLRAKMHNWYSGMHSRLLFSFSIRYYRPTGAMGQRFSYKTTTVEPTRHCGALEDPRKGFSRHSRRTPIQNDLAKRWLRLWAAQNRRFKFRVTESDHPDDKEEESARAIRTLPRDGRDLRSASTASRATSSYYADRCLVARLCARCSWKGAPAVRACGCFITDIFPHSEHLINASPFLTQTDL